MARLSRILLEANSGAGLGGGWVRAAGHGGWLSCRVGGGEILLPFPCMLALHCDHLPAPNQRGGGQPFPSRVGQGSALLWGGGKKQKKVRVRLDCSDLHILFYFLFKKEIKKEQQPCVC